VLGGETVGDFDGALERGDANDGRIAGNRLGGHGGIGEQRKLASDFLGDGRGQAFGGGQQDGRGIHIVLGLGQQIGRQAGRIAFGGNDQDLGGTGDEINADFAR